jgi:DNA-binding MarR family transcriptional regulator
MRKKAARSNRADMLSEGSFSAFLDKVEAAWLAERPDLDLRLACTMLKLERASQLHERRVEAISKKIGLHTGELRVLLALRRSGRPYEQRPTDLFRTLLVTSGAVTKRVARLQEAGMIIRIPASDDGRSENVRLTPKGFTISDRAISEIAREVQHVQTESGLSESEIEVLDLTLSKLLNATSAGKAGTAKRGKSDSA